MFSIDNDKASGPNGYSTCFFKKTRSIIGPIECAIIRDFFDTSSMLNQVNATIRLFELASPRAQMPESIKLPTSGSSQTIHKEELHWELMLLFTMIPKVLNLAHLSNLWLIWHAF